MSKEILEAVRGLAAEKNISSEKLMEALEDALLSAYKKTPGAARHAKVEMDRESGDFKVYELKIPEEIEAQLLVDPSEPVGALAAFERAAALGERRESRARRVPLAEEVVGHAEEPQRVVGPLAAWVARERILEFCSALD